MTRWMITAAAMGAVAASAYGQSSDAGRSADARPARVDAEAVVIAQAADVAPPAPTAAPAPGRAPGALPPAPRDVPAVPPPPAVPVAGNFLIDARPGKMEKVTYLGAVTTAAPAAMREQLKLAPGVGLVVDRVEPNTPAEKAGLKQHDLIEKLDDQLLINPEQLATLLRSKKPGDEVTLGIVRQGEHQSVKAKLEEKEVDANAYRLIRAGNDVFPVPAQFAQGAPGFAPGAITLQDRVGGATATWGGGVGMAAGGKRVTVRTMDDGKQTTVWADDEVSISIDRAGGKVAGMVVKDRKTEKPLYTGNGDEQGLKPLLEARPELGEKIKKAMDAATRDPMRLPIQGTPTGKGIAGGGGRVLRWQDDAHVLVLRMAGRSPSYLLALSKKDGRTIFDGPVASEEDRRSVPAEVAEQFQMLTAQPELAQELGGPVKPAAAIAPVPATPKK